MRDPFTRKKTAHGRRSLKSYRGAWLLRCTRPRGIGKKRQDDVAAKALVIQEAAAKRLARQSREEVIAWLRSKLDRLDLPDGAPNFSRTVTAGTQKSP